MSTRDVWLRAGTILAEHGDRSADYIIAQLHRAFGNSRAVEDWRRVAAVLDFIADAEPSS
jgi:hypothetical protein